MVFTFSLFAPYTMIRILKWREGVFQSLGLSINLCWLPGYMYLLPQVSKCSSTISLHPSLYLSVYLWIPHLNSQPFCRAQTKVFLAFHNGPSGLASGNIPSQRLFQLKSLYLVHSFQDSVKPAYTKARVAVS